MADRSRRHSSTSRTGKVSAGCQSPSLAGFYNPWAFVGSIATRDTTGSGGVLYVAEYGFTGSLPWHSQHQYRWRHLHPDRVAEFRRGRLVERRTAVDHSVPAASVLGARWRHRSDRPSVAGETTEVEKCKAEVAAGLQRACRKAKTDQGVRNARNASSSLTCVVMRNPLVRPRRSAICPDRPIPASPLLNPLDLYSQNGVLTVEPADAERDRMSNGFMHYCYIYMYQGQQIEAPTLRLNPGDTLVMNLTNNLQAPSGPDDRPSRCTCMACITPRARPTIAAATTLCRRRPISTSTA